MANRKKVLFIWDKATKYLDNMILNQLIHAIKTYQPTIKRIELNLINQTSPTTFSSINRIKDM